jgi:hypothetical protein
MVCACSQSQSNVNATYASNENPTTMTSEEKKSAPPADVLKLVKHEIMDKEGTGLVASTFLLPADWTAQTRLFWEYNDATLPVRLQGIMQSASGDMGIQLFPDVRAVWSSGPTGTSGYPPPQDIISGMKDLITRERSGKNIQFISQKIIENNSQNTGQGIHTNQAGVIQIQYDNNGQPTEEEFYGRLDVTSAVMPSVYGNITSVVWAASGLSACKAVKGKLETCRKIAETVITSSRITKPFLNRLLQIVQLLSDQVYAQIYAAGQISRIISQTNDQMIANIDATYQQVQTAADKNNNQFSDYMRGVDRYDEGGTEVQLPSGYSNAWVNDKGEYLLSSSPGYNPSDDFHGNWKALKKN